MPNDNSLISDHTITPFGATMKQHGYVPVTLGNGRVVLQACIKPVCRKVYSTLYKKQNRRYWACPDCGHMYEKID